MKYEKDIPKRAKIIYDYDGKGGFIEIYPSRHGLGYYSVYNCGPSPMINDEDEEEV